MSPLPVRIIPKKEVVLNSVAEFLGCWAVGGKATLSLNTQDGVATIVFSNTLSGHPEDPLHPPPAPTGPAPQRRRRRHRGPARRERDRQRAARHQAAQAGAPPASPPPAATPAAPSTPEGLRDSGKSILDTLTISPTNEKREEEEDPSSPDLKPGDPPWWKEDDIDWSVNETNRIMNEQGRTGKCYFCDFSCEPNLNSEPSPWYNLPLLDHQEEVHPETEEWFA